MLYEVQAISAVNSEQREFQTFKFSKVWCQLATLYEKVGNPNSFDLCSGCSKVCLVSFFKFLAISIFKSGKIASPNNRAQTSTHLGVQFSLNEVLFMFGKCQSTIPTVKNITVLIYVSKYSGTVQNANFLAIFHNVR